MDKLKLIDRVVGMFLGIAIGDALGMPFEKIFTPAELLALPDEAFANYQDPPAGHKFHDGKIKAGETTDDTQLSLVVAESLITCGGIDMNDMARQHVAAMDQRVSGWGRGTTSAIEKIKAGVPWDKAGVPNGAGNGIMMKTSPVGAFIASVPKGSFQYGKAFEGALDLALMTHHSRMGLAQGWIQAELIRLCLDWEEKEGRNSNNPDFILHFMSCAIIECVRVEGWWAGRQMDTIKERLVDRLTDLLYERRYNEDLATLAARYGAQPFYVYDSMPLAYSCFLKDHDSFQAVINAIRVGGDTDTNASIVGALLGAKNGIAVFPPELIDGLKEKRKIFDVAERFCETFIN